MCVCVCMHIFSFIFLPLKNRIFLLDPFFSNICFLYKENRRNISKQTLHKVDFSRGAIRDSKLKWISLFSFLCNFFTCQKGFLNLTVQTFASCSLMQCNMEFSNWMSLNKWYVLSEILFRNITISWNRSNVFSFWKYDSFCKVSDFQSNDCVVLL